MVNRIKALKVDALYKKESDGQYHVYAGTFNNKANYDKVVAKLNAAGIKTTQK